MFETFDPKSDKDLIRPILKALGEKDKAGCSGDGRRKKTPKMPCLTKTHPGLRANPRVWRIERWHVICTARNTCRAPDFSRSPISDRGDVRSQNRAPLSNGCWWWANSKPRWKEIRIGRGLDKGGPKSSKCRLANTLSSSHHLWTSTVTSF